MFARRLFLLFFEVVEGTQQGGIVLKNSYILEIMREKLNGVRVKENSKMISFETRTVIG